MTYEFKIDGLPISYNKHFQIIWSLKQCQLSPEAHNYKNRIKMSMPPIEVKDNDLFALDIYYHYSWFYKNGKLRKIDTANCDKILIDAIAERLGIDDSRFKRRNVVDIHEVNNEFTIVRIIPLNKTYE